jgi:3'-5' exoribonuclease
MNKPATDRPHPPVTGAGPARGAPATGSAALQPGMPVRGIFVVKKKVGREHASGGKFLLFQFSDSTGSINGVLWEDAEAVERSVTTGDLVHVEGEVQLYQGARQVRVRRIVRADPAAFDLSAFLPRSPHDTAAQYARLEAAIATLQEPHLQALCQSLFGDPDFAAAYRAAPAGKGWHHAHVGGLVEHVASMLELGEVLVHQHAAVERDLVVAGILLHDLGKVEELVWRSHIEYTDAGRLVGHLVQGCLLVARHMDAIPGFPAELRLRLLHVIVSHHGSLDRGSPKPPMTLEAMAVHLLDQLDSQVQAVAQVVERAGAEEGWSEHVKLLDRVFFRGRQQGGVPGDALPGA